MKVVTVVGNRPQFVKAAPLSVAFREAGIDEVVVHTGQHWDDELSQVFIDELGLEEPVHRLDLRTADVAALTPAVGDALDTELPDLVVVLGDTNSTLAGARAGAERGLRIAHVEAGLRSGDLSMPEERARIEVDRLAALLLCPDERSAETLHAERVPGRIEVVGDVMADATLRFVSIARERVPPQIPGRGNAFDGFVRAGVCGQPRRRRHPAGSTPDRCRLRDGTRRTTGGPRVGGQRVTATG